MENTGASVAIFIAIVVVGFFAYLARRMDKRRHQDQLERIQERIRRSEANASPATDSTAGSGPTATANDPGNGIPDP